MSKQRSEERDLEKKSILGREKFPVVVSNKHTRPHQGRFMVSLLGMACSYKLYETNAHRVAQREHRTIYVSFKAPSSSSSFAIVSHWPVSL